jgi:hypothetical protein
MASTRSALRTTERFDNARQPSLMLAYAALPIVQVGRYPATFCESRSCLMQQLAFSVLKPSLFPSPGVLTKVPRKLNPSSKRWQDGWQSGQQRSLGATIASSVYAGRVCVFAGSKTDYTAILWATDHGKPAYMVAAVVVFRDEATHFDGLMVF